MTLTDCCSTGFKHEGTPDGSVSTLFGLETYSVGGQYGWDRVIVIFSDIFGHNFLNNQLAADQLSISGNIQVLIPDLLEGDAVKDFGSLDFPAWASKHSHDRLQGIVDPFLAKLTLKHLPKAIFGIGHCFGAPQVFRQLTDGGYLTRGAVAHPSMVTEDNIGIVKKPLLISTGPTDVVFRPELRNKTLEILTKNDVLFQMEIFAGADHGYVVRGDISNARVKYAKEKTTLHQIEWFNADF